MRRDHNETKITDIADCHGALHAYHRPGVGKGSGFAISLALAQISNSPSDSNKHAAYGPAISMVLKKLLPLKFRLTQSKRYAKMI